MRISTVIITLIILAGCTGRGAQSLKQGVWRGVIRVQGQALPFNFSVVKDSVYKVFVKNAEENLLLDEIRFEDDSVIFRMHIFDAELKAKIAGDSLRGFFVKTSEKDYRLPFYAAYDQDFRFEEEYPSFNSSGKWRVTFTNPADTTEAVGLFQQNGDIVTGTFLTATGDYRFLEGNVAGDTLQVSTFDGNHAYLFKAVLQGDTLKGEYWSGKSWHQAWTGVRDENASLPDAESLTYLKEGYEKIDFSFPDLAGRMVSPSDEKYRDKVLILQIAGSWCPNCMDETRFLVPWYNENRDRGVEIIGLFYEAKADVDYARGRVKKMVDKFEIPYDVVIAGTKSKDEASKTLPMLNRVVSFPTTIFIGRDGKVKKIHTGFSGPGTGIYYEQFIQHFNETVADLLSENLAEARD